MIRIVWLLAVMFTLAACSSFQPPKNADHTHGKSLGHMTKADNYYGYTPENAIKVGAFENTDKPRFNDNHHIFFSRLRGPNGSKVRYKRRGSCCSVSSRNFPLGDTAPLDVYEVTYNGLEKPLIIYINMYDRESPRAPHGFRWVE